MRFILVIGLLAGCGGGKGGGDEWEVRQDELAEALCQNACVSADEQENCLSDVLADMMQARDELADSEEAACIACMEAKIDAISDVVANGCRSNAEIDAQVLAACDDPSTDFDQDGDPANDFSEACAGAP